MPRANLRMATVERVGCTGLAVRVVQARTADVRAALSQAAYGASVVPPTPSTLPASSVVSSPTPLATDTGAKRSREHSPDLSTQGRREMQGTPSPTFETYIMWMHGYTAEA